MTIPENIAIDLIANLFSSFLETNKAEDSPETIQSIDDITGVLNTEDFKKASSESLQKLDIAIGNSQIAFQRQGFIQGFCEAVNIYKKFY